MWLDAVVRQCDNAGGEVVVVVNAKRQAQGSESCHSRGGDNRREKKGALATASMQASARCGWLLWYIVAATLEGVAIVTGRVER